MACMVACAAASVRHSARRRPKMSQVRIIVCNCTLFLILILHPQTQINKFREKQKTKTFIHWLQQIVRALEGDVSLDDLNEGVKPGQSSLFGESGSDLDSSTYSSNMRRFREIALGSNDDYSNDYNSGMISEYGANLPESSSSGEMDYGEGRRKKPSPYRMWK